MRKITRRGAILVELLLAISILGGAGLMLLALLETGDVQERRNEAVAAAAGVAARVMDRLQALGFRRLAASTGEGRAIPVAALLGDSGASDPGTLVSDGAVFVATADIVEPRPGLLRVELHLAWNLLGANLAGRVSLLRLITDPTARCDP